MSDFTELNIQAESPQPIGDTGVNSGLATKRVCAICSKSLTNLDKKQSTRYCSAKCKDKAKYIRGKSKRGLHNTKNTTIG